MTSALSVDSSPVLENLVLYEYILKSAVLAGHWRQICMHARYNLWRPGGPGGKPKREAEPHYVRRLQALSGGASRKAAPITPHLTGYYDGSFLLIVRTHKQQLHTWPTTGNSAYAAPSTGQNAAFQWTKEGPHCVGGIEEMSSSPIGSDPKEEKEGKAATS